MLQQAGLEMIPHSTISFLTLNAMGLYSSGLILQTVGLSIRRWQATLIDTALCTFLASIALFSFSFNNVYSEFLGVLIIFLAPWCAIYLTNAWLRRNTYDPVGLLTRGSGPYW